MRSSCEIWAIYRLASPLDGSQGSAVAVELALGAGAECPDREVSNIVKIFFFFG